MCVCVVYSVLVLMLFFVYNKDQNTQWTLTVMSTLSLVESDNVSRSDNSMESNTSVVSECVVVI